MDRPRGAGITKDLAPTTGSGSFLPQAASDWPGKEMRGQARGVQAVQAFDLRQVWLVGMQPRGSGWYTPLFWQEAESQILKGESLPAGGLPGSSHRHHGASRLQGPSKVAEQSPRLPLLPAVRESYIQALSRPSTAELQDQGRTKALGGSMDSNIVERFLWVRGGPLGWGGGHW